MSGTVWKLRLSLAAAAIALVVANALAQPAYYPERNEWQRRPPAEAGFDPAKLDAAVRYAIASESPNPRPRR